MRTVHNNHNKRTWELIYYYIYLEAVDPSTLNHHLARKKKKKKKKNSESEMWEKRRRGVISSVSLGSSPVGGRGTGCEY